MFSDKDGRGGRNPKRKGKVKKAGHGWGGGQADARWGRRFQRCIWGEFRWRWIQKEHHLMQIFLGFWQEWQRSDQHGWAGWDDDKPWEKRSNQGQHYIQSTENLSKSFDRQIGHFVLNNTLWHQPNAVSPLNCDRTMVSMLWRGCMH